MSRQKFESQVYESLKKEHHDIAYYKREDICMILSKGLATTCENQPRNPIEYFGKWLMEYSNVQKEAKKKKQKSLFDREKQKI